VERPRVLLADDHQAMLALTAEALAGECLVVGRVGDGCELLAEAERVHRDIIVPDVTMPRLDGIEAARQLMRSQRPARLVFLRSTKMPTTPAPHLMRADSAMS
jgi:CheY-like chemotaxis protein